MDEVIDIAEVDSLKVLDPKGPISEAVIGDCDSVALDKSHNLPTYLCSC